MIDRVALICCCLLVAGCTGQEPSEGTGESRPTASVAFVTNGADPFWVLAQRGVEDAAAKLGINATVHMPTEGVADQKRILEDLLVKQISGIAVSPIDPVNQTEFLNQCAERTHLITHDSDAPDSKRRCFIGVDNYDAGRLCGELVKEALPEGGEVYIFVGRLEQDNARRRRQGVIDELLDRSHDPNRFDPAGAPISGGQYTILGTLTDQFDRAKAKANVEDVLSRHPDVDGFIGLFAYNPPLALEVLNQSGKLGKIKVIGFDEADETLAGIQAGTVHGTIVQNPYQYGYQSVEVLQGLIDEKAPPASVISVPARAIRKAEVDEFWADKREKLGQG